MMDNFDFEKFEELSKERDLEDVIRNFDWKSFEQIVANIFEKNGFRIRTNFRFKTSRRFEIDVIAISDLYVFCIDCKEWGRGRDKTSGLKNAVKMQEERTDELEKFLNHNQIAKKMMKIENSKEFYSLIVTWHEEDLKKENESLIVPISKLNSLIGNFEVTAESLMKHEKSFYEAED